MDWQRLFGFITFIGFFIAFVGEFGLIITSLL